MANNLIDFNDRVSRLRKAHVNGLGFEAEGTLGRSHYSRRRGFRLPLMGPVLVLLAVVLLLKSAIYVHIGGQTYQDKVDLLWQGSPVDQLGAVVMQPDSLTIWLAGRFRHAS